MLALAVLAVIVTNLVLKSRDEVMENTLQLRRSQLASFDDGVSLYVAYNLLRSRYPLALRIDGVSQRRRILDTDVDLTLTTEFGKVDLNAAGTGSLARLFRAAGLGPVESDNEAQLVDCWRHPRLAPSRLFRSIVELQVVAGLKSTLFSKIRNSITVYSHHGQVDQSSADYLALQTIPGIDPSAAAVIIQDRLANREGGTLTALMHGQLAPGISSSGWAFSIVASFLLDGRLELLDRTILSTGDPLMPAMTLWPGVSMTDASPVPLHQSL